MDERRCGAPTRKGTPCRLLAGECEYHTVWRAARTRGDRAAVVAPSPPPAFDASRATPAALQQRDLRGLGWWVIERVLGEELPAQNASVLASVMRILATLGPEPLAEEEAWKEVELRGLLMHGDPPRNAEEWRRAAEIFDDASLAEFRRWEEENRVLDEAALNERGETGEKLAT